MKYVDLSVRYVGIHRHKKTDPESIIFCPYRIRIKITSGWKQIQIHLVEYVYSLCSKVCWVYRHKMDSESLIFCPGRIQIINLFFKPNLGQNQTCSWRRIQFILVKCAYCTVGCVETWTWTIKRIRNHSFLIRTGSGIKPSLQLESGSDWSSGMDSLYSKLCWSLAWKRIVNHYFIFLSFQTFYWFSYK